MVIYKTKVAESFHIMRTIAELVNRLRARKSISCEELNIDRTAHEALKQADLSTLKDSDMSAALHDKKVANAL